mmetsp:Transcript_20943/g.67869  ORF Transcript_20943/g.67869 Transcript_20943/m.67869 type:complete len:101 (+) Transcript_20943:633-935(+)
MKDGLFSVRAGMCVAKADKEGTGINEQLRPKVPVDRMRALHPDQQHGTVLQLDGIRSENGIVARRSGAAIVRDRQARTKGYMVRTTRWCNAQRSRKWDGK